MGHLRRPLFLQGQIDFSGAKDFGTLGTNLSQILVQQTPCLLPECVQTLVSTFHSDELPQNIGADRSFGQRITLLQLGNRHGDHLLLHRRNAALGDGLEDRILSRRLINRKISLPGNFARFLRDCVQFGLNCLEIWIVGIGRHLPIDGFNRVEEFALGGEELFKEDIARMHWIARIVPEVDSAAEDLRHDLDFGASELVFHRGEQGVCRIDGSLGNFQRESSLRVFHDHFVREVDVAFGPVEGGVELDIGVEVGRVDLRYKILVVVRNPLKRRFI